MDIFENISLLIRVVNHFTLHNPFLFFLDNMWNLADQKDLRLELLLCCNEKSKLR